MVESFDQLLNNFPIFNSSDHCNILYRYCKVLHIIVATFCVIVTTLRDCVETSKCYWKKLIIVQSLMQNGVQMRTHCKKTLYFKNYFPVVLIFYGKVIIFYEFPIHETENFYFKRHIRIFYRKSVYIFNVETVR